MKRRSGRTGSSPSRCMLVSALCLIAANSAGAQQTTGGDARGDAVREVQSAPASEPSLDQWIARLEALQAELEAEKTALAEAEKTQQQEIAELEKQRADLAGKLLDAQIASERNRGRLEAARQQAEQAKERAQTLQDLAGSVAGDLRDAAEQLRIHLNEVPAADAEVEQLRDLSKSLAPSDDADPVPQAGAAEALLVLIDRAYRAGSTIAVQPATIYTASGDLEKVQLLSIGHARFAYITSEDERVGLALSSPRDASGYRWSEQLSRDQRQQVRDAVAALETQQAGWFSVPVDPTGSIEPAALAQEPTLWSRFASGGAVMYPLAAIALAGLLLIGERTIRLYVANQTNDAAVGGVLQAAGKRDFSTARRKAEECRGAVGAVLVACLDRREAGQRAMEDSIQEQLLHELPRLQRFMGGIAMLAAVAPLLGLLGTVTGIIRTFGVIQAFGNATPSLMAGGISEALVTTATGLIIAVPILICHSILRGRGDRVLADAERYAASLLTVLASGAPGMRPSGSRSLAKDAGSRAEQDEEAGVV